MSPSMPNQTLESVPVLTALSRGPCPSFWLLAARYLDEYLEKIARAIEDLDDQDIWWRPSPDTNSIGNLMLHLAGNLGLWIGHGLGGGTSQRDRSGEFAADHTVTGAEAFQLLRSAVARCCRILEVSEGRDLGSPLAIQGYRTDVLGALFHAVEHMSYHAGQILWVAKLRRGPNHGLELYPQHAGE